MARLRSAQQSFWVLPVVAIVVGICCGLVFPDFDRAVTLPDAIALSASEDTARPVLGTIVTVGVSVAGVSFSVLAVALVLASQQLSPRVLRSFQRQPLNQAVLALLLGTSTYALFVLGSIGDTRSRPMPELSLALAMLLAAGSVALFAVFLHHAVRSMDASVVIRRIAAEGHESIAHPYPAGVGRAASDGTAEQRAAGAPDDLPCRAEARAPRAGYIASVDEGASSSGPHRPGPRSRGCRRA